MLSKKAGYVGRSPSAHRDPAAGDVTVIRKFGDVPRT
jgi:hypothetical protein